MKRRTILLYDYKNRPCKVALTKDGGWWWSKRLGAMGERHCVISCYNEATVVYITDYGYARIAYCQAHADNRILGTMLSGMLERGVWAISDNGKLKPHWHYKHYMGYMKKVHPKQAKKLEEKLRGFNYK